ncbi:unnamed protein product [Urochloa humidicola]
MAVASSVPKAVFEGAVPPPRPALAPPQLRSRLALVAADILMCLCFPSSWISFAGLATAIVGERACGEDCPVVEAALMVSAAATLSFGLTFIASTLLWSKSDPDTESEKVQRNPDQFRGLMCPRANCA